MDTGIILPESWKDWSVVGSEPIGWGSYGEVYKAERTLGDRKVYSAVKIIDIPHDEEELQSLRLEYEDEESLKAYFLDIKDSYVKEIELMMDLRGVSNIVSIEDFLVEEKDEIGWRIYIRMEYLQDLRLWIRENEMSEEEVIKLAADICNALTYCEKQNVMHRDIKPANILRSSMGDYKLGDFGIARFSRQSSGSYSTKGTYEYMAPEVYKGQHYGSNADIYSLGIVLYWLTNRTHEKKRNRFPFESTYKEMLTYQEKENALDRRMNGETFPAPTNASPKLAKIILKACAYNPEDRYQHASEMLQDLNNLKGIPVQSPEPEQKEEETSGGHRKAFLTAAVIIGAALIFAGIGTARYFSGNGENLQETEEVQVIETSEETEEETEEQLIETEAPVIPETQAEAVMQETESEMEIQTESETAQQKTTEITESETTVVATEAAETTVESEDSGSQENKRVYQKYKDYIDQALDGFTSGDPLYTKNLSVGQSDTPQYAHSSMGVAGYSTDESVVTVNTEGKVTAVGPGTAYVVILWEDTIKTAERTGGSPMMQVYQYNVSDGTSDDYSTGAAGFDSQQTLDDLSQQLNEWMNSIN